jgi:aspartyl protease family protein
MLYWPLVIIGSVVLGVLLAGEPRGADLADGMRRLAIYVSVLGGAIMLAGLARILAHERARDVARAGALSGLVALLFGAVAFQDDLRPAAERIRAGLQPSVALSRAEGEVELRRAWDGHYRATTAVNGVEMRMMVDTGASMVLLPHEALPALGVDPARLVYSIPVSTANGPSAVAPLMLEEVQVGSIRMRNVRAAVAQPGRLESALLGMSFLERLSETSFVDGKLILRQESRRNGGRFISVSDQH